MKDASSMTVGQTAKQLRVGRKRRKKPIKLESRTTHGLVSVSMACVFVFISMIL